MALDDERRARDEGMRRAMTPIPPDFKEAIYFVIDHYAATGTTFTADDVRKTLRVNGFGRDLKKWPNIGGLFGSRSRAGAIRMVGAVKPTDLDGGHARPYPVWIGVNPS